MSAETAFVDIIREFGAFGLLALVVWRLSNDFGHKLDKVVELLTEIRGKLS